jgi:O-antigen/teichoic acid export membrane protein
MEKELRLMKGNEAVGWYNAAYRLILILSFFSTAYFGAVFPIMSRFHTASRDFLKFTHERSFKYLLMLGVPIGVGTTLLANKIIILIFGWEYNPSIIVLQILVWSLVFQFVIGVFANLFQSVNRQMIVVWVLGGAAVLKVVLNIVLIPEHSYTGAGIATVASAFIASGLSFIWSSRIGYGISVKSTIGIIIRVSIACAIMCIFILYLKNFNILALILISALLYLAVLYIIGGLDKEDRLLLRTVFIRQKPIDTDSEDEKSG